MALKGFRLLTGEILLAAVIVEEETSVEIANVFSLVGKKDENGNMGFTLQPYLNFASGPLRLMKYSVCTIFDLNSDFITEYNIAVLAHTSPH